MKKKLANLMKAKSLDANSHRPRLKTSITSSMMIIMRKRKVIMNRLNVLFHFNIDSIVHSLSSSMRYHERCLHIFHESRGGFFAVDLFDSLDDAKEALNGLRVHSDWLREPQSA